MRVPKLRFNIFLQNQTLFFNWQHTFPSSSDTSDVLSIHMSFQIGFLLKFIGVTDQTFFFLLCLLSLRLFSLVFSIPHLRNRSCDDDKYVRSSTTGISRNTALERETPESRWPHINVEMANRKVLTAKNATEHRDLGTVDGNIKCEWENKAKIAELR